MRRGDVFTVADSSGAYTGKPRPALVIQDYTFEELESVIVIPVTTTYAEAARLRIALEPSGTLPLRATSYVEIEKVTTMRRARVGRFIGRIPPEAMRAVERSLLIVLGMTSPPTGTAPAP